MRDKLRDDGKGFGFYRIIKLKNSRIARIITLKIRAYSRIFTHN